MAFDGLNDREEACEFGTGRYVVGNEYGKSGADGENRRVSVALPSAPLCSTHTQRSGENRGRGGGGRQRACAVRNELI